MIGGVLVGSLREVEGTRPALLLHGGPGMNDYLDSLADELDGLLTTARYQQRGLAPSVETGDRSIEGHVTDAVVVMDHLGWDAPIVIGHSWGGHFAMHLAVARPDRVGALVILDALGPVGDGGIAEFGPALQRGLTDAQMAWLDELDAKEMLTAEERTERMAVIWPNYFGDPASAPPQPDFRFDPESAHTWESINRHFDAATLERGLPTVTAPALVIHGGQSPIPLEQARQTAELLPNATLVEHPGKGHWSWLEEPGFVREQVTSWLPSLDSDPLSR